jgi:uncharacterized protein
MAAFLISPESLPATGKLYVLDDQSIWLDPLEEFGLNCRIRTPLIAEITLLPQEEGVLARGGLRGEVAVPCNRCAEDAAVRIDQDIDSFEPYPVRTEPAGPRKRKGAEAEDAIRDPDVDASVMRVNPETRRLEMDLAALAWQEFSLALPAKPLCDTRCKGLCPVCGANKNTEECACARDEGDPRLAALRGLTIQR